MAPGMQNSYTLLSVLQSFAPRASAQQVCTVMRNNMIADGMSDTDITAELASAIHNGIKYGNWPWTITINGKKDS